MCAVSLAAIFVALGGVAGALMLGGVAGKESLGSF